MASIQKIQQWQRHPEMADVRFQSSGLHWDFRLMLYYINNSGCRHQLMLVDLCSRKKSADSLQLNSGAFGNPVFFMKRMHNIQIMDGK